jgi:uncharacterized delta-60 repeat protein
MQRIFKSLAGMFLSGSLLTSIAVAQTANDGFDPNVAGTVGTMAAQADGKLVVGGNFSMIGTQSLGGLGRVNADGSVDTSVTLPTDGTVNALAVQSDGGIVFGGYFSHVGLLARNNLARLKADGSLDPGFDPNINGVIRALLVQPDGRIVIGGTFSQVGAQAQNYLARLNANGSLDTSFVNATTFFVTALARQSDGKLLLTGGGFAHAITRLNADGTVDGSFTLAPTSIVVNAMVQQVDGKLLAGGSDQQTHGGLARFNADGSLDGSFADPGINGNVFPGIESIVTQSDGTMVIAGSFTQIGTSLHHGVARLHADGSLDAGFNPGTNGGVNALVTQSDGKVVLGGAFTQVGGAARKGLARVYADGSVQGIFIADTDGAVRALAQQPDGKALIGGDFTHIGTTTQVHNYLARLNADGSVDSTFNPSASGSVVAFLVMPDGKIIVGGYFSTVSTQTCDGIVRLNADGSVDTTFSANTNGSVFALAAQADGKLIVGGSFGTIGGHARSGIARLNADGSVDESFNPNAGLGTTTHYTYALALQPDGKVIVGGGFLPVGSQDQMGLLRLNADGSLDTAFNSNATDASSTTNNSNVYVLTLQPDGKILVGGQFTTIGGQTRNRIARLNADGSVDSVFDPGADNSVFAMTLRTDGEIIAGGAFTGIAGHARNYVGALNADGTGVGTAFNPNANGFVAAITISVDAKLLLGGGFTTIGQPPQSRQMLARLSVQDATQQSISTNGSTVTWKRSGAGPELSLPPDLLYSPDGNNFTSLGSMQRIIGSWRYYGLLQPPGQIYYLRTRARVASGSGNSQGLIENTSQLFGDDRIFSDAFE